MPLHCQTTPTSTIVQLLYAGPQSIDFSWLLSELHEALTEYMATEQQFDLVRNDLAFLDTPTGRLTLSLQTGLKGTHTTCLTLGVGNGPADSGLGPVGIAGQQTVMARRLTQAICETVPVDQTLWHIVPQVVTADIIDTLAQKLPEIAPRQVESSEPHELPRILRQVEETLKARAEGHPEGEADPDDSRSLMARLGLTGGRGQVETLVEVDDALPAVGPAQQDPSLRPANDIPQVPACDLTELQQVRQALYGYATAKDRRHVSVRMGLGASHSSNLVIYLPFADKAGRAIKRMDHNDFAHGARALAVMGTVSGLPNVVEAANMIGLI
ncbi:MAG: hypothetical protein P8N72_13515 [Flavimaricola sp.]|nr:hypothetical protein [Flavimaricola sp.]